MIRTRLLLIAVVPLLVLGACGSDKDEADPTPSTPTPSASTPATTATTATPTPEPTPTPAPTTATTSAAPSRGPIQPVIDYGDDGVTLKTAADVRKLTGAPADFTAFMTRELARAQSDTDEACTQKPQLVVNAIDVGGWASGSQFIPQCGGSATLWAKPGGTWKEVWSGQELVSCKTLFTYAFPADIVGKTCLDGGKEVPYAHAGVAE